MHNFPNTHNQGMGTFRPNRWVYSVTIYGKNGTVVGGGSVDRDTPIQSSDEYKGVAVEAVEQMGSEYKDHVVILNLINNPSWR